MAQLLIDSQSTPPTPAAGLSFLYPDNVSKRWMQKDDAGVVSTLGDIVTASTANQTGFAADTYLLGSSIQVPRGLPKATTTYRSRFDMVKTAAGAAAATVIIRYGTAGTIADTARVTFTFGAGTAAIDTGIFEVFAHFRNVGAAAVLVAMCRCTHHLAATGLISTGASGTGIILVTSGTFDTTGNDNFIGLSVNGGASFAGTNTVVESELCNA